MRPRRLAAGLCALLAVLLIPVATSSALGPTDYTLEGGRWNGLTYLLQTAEEADVVVEQVDELRMDRLGPHHVILWIHPVTDLPTTQLLAFVRNGGRLIVADDVGSAAPLFEAIGLRRAVGSSAAHESLYGRNPHLPVVRGGNGHFTMFNVDEVVANHPARIYGDGNAVLSFEGDEGGHLAIEVEVGQGAVLAISDPSIFITQMLTRFYGNKQFVANVLRVYLDTPRTQLLLALPHTTISGTYGRLGPLPDLFRWSGARLNHLARTASSGLKKSPWPHVIAGLLLFLGLLLVRVVSVRVLPESSAGLWSEPLPSTSPRDMHRRALVAGREHADFSEPAQSLLTEGLSLGQTTDALPPDCHAAHLRIQGMAASFPGASKLLRVNQTQFLTLSGDVSLLREHIYRRHDDTP